jgi:hypothetical protein
MQSMTGAFYAAEAGRAGGSCDISLQNTLSLGFCCSGTNARPQRLAKDRRKIDSFSGKHTCIRRADLLFRRGGPVWPPVLLKVLTLFYAFLRSLFVYY